MNLCSSLRPKCLIQPQCMHLRGIAINVTREDLRNRISQALKEATAKLRESDMKANQSLQENSMIT